MGQVRHPIYSNSREVKCGYQPKKGINIAKHCVNSYSINAAPAQSITHMSCWWCVYEAQSNGGEYATRPVTWATGSVKFSIRAYKVPSEPSEPSEPSGTPGCFRRKLGLLLKQVTRVFRYCVERQGNQYSMKAPFSFRSLILISHCSCNRRQPFSAP